jgi:hypothetical protein
MNYLFSYCLSKKFYLSAAEENYVPFYPGVCSIWPFNLFLFNFFFGSIAGRLKKSLVIISFISRLFLNIKIKKISEWVAKMKLYKTEQTKILKFIFFVWNHKEYVRQKNVPFHPALPYFVNWIFSINAHRIFWLT